MKAFYLFEEKRKNIIFYLGTFSAHFLSFYLTYKGFTNSTFLLMFLLLEMCFMVALVKNEKIEKKGEILYCVIAVFYKFFIEDFLKNISRILSDYQVVEINPKSEIQENIISAQNEQHIKEYFESKPIWEKLNEISKNSTEDANQNHTVSAVLVGFCIYKGWISPSKSWKKSIGILNSCLNTKFNDETRKYGSLKIDISDSFQGRNNINLPGNILAYISILKEFENQL